MKNLTGRQKSLVELLRKKGITDKNVLDAFMKVPRHYFVDEALINGAYEDKALPIGNGQTISQPYIVALMTQALDLNNETKVLEIGTGSGFQTAILASLSKVVFSVERDVLLSRRAKNILRQIGFQNIIFKTGDGTRGWIANAPYDRIIVTAGATKDIPKSLLNQLTDNGRMIIPSGDRITQQLLTIDKRGNEVTKQNICDVAFVPLIGKEGWIERK